MQAYHDLLRRILDEGDRKADRTGTGTLSVFGHQMRFDLAQGFPLVTTKKLHLKSIVHELLWFLAATPTSPTSRTTASRIWDEWADEQRRSRPRLRQAVALAGRSRTAARSTRSAGLSTRSGATRIRAA